MPSAPEQVQAEALLNQVDDARLAWHSQQIKEGMERARQKGKRIGRPAVIEREGFSERFTAVVECLGQGRIPRREAAKQLNVGYATLKRLIDARLAAVHFDGRMAGSL